MRVAGCVALAVAAAAAAVGAVALTRLPSPDLGEFDPVEPIVAAPVEIEDDLARPVDLELTWTPLAGPVSPGASGVITDWFANEGTRLEHGSPVYAVDGGVVSAFATPTPLWRALARGDRGADVDAAAAGLEALGYEVGSRAPGDPVGRRLADAFREYADDHGLPRTGVFDPAYLVWLGTPDVVVGAPLYRIGQPAPPAGVDLFAPVPRLTAVQVRDAQDPAGGSRDSGLATDEQAWVVRVGETAVPLDLLGEGAPEALEEVAGAVPAGAPSAEAVLALSRPRTLQIVPSAALVEGPAGVCVVAPDRRTTTVRIVGGSIGQVLVDGELPDRLVVNPHLAWLEPPAC